MALVGVELETLVSEPDALTVLIFYYRSICIIDNGASRHRTQNARFRVRRADHSTTKRRTRTTRFPARRDFLCIYMKNISKFGFKFRKTRPNRQVTEKKKKTYIYTKRQ